MGLHACESGTDGESRAGSSGGGCRRRARDGAASGRASDRRVGADVRVRLGGLVGRLGC
jgi:hypothetical protein